CRTYRGAGRRILRSGRPLFPAGYGDTRKTGWRHLVLQIVSLRVHKIHPNIIFSIQSRPESENLALEILRVQARACQVYGDFVKHVGIKAGEVKDFKRIPYLPIEFFKSHTVISGTGPVEEIFSSSGTSGMAHSRHHVLDTRIYTDS